MPIDYQKSKIYKLWSPSKNIVYIGSTTETLAQRLAKHKANHKAYNNDNTKNYCSSYLVLDCEDYKIELLEEYACNNRQQLFKKEGEYIKNNECINQFIAGRTKQEYYNDNIDKIKQYRIDNIDKTKEYYIDNVDKLKEQHKQYYINNIDKLKEQNKQYYINNADKKKEYQKQYNIANADKISEQKKQYYLKKKAE